MTLLHALLLIAFTSPPATALAKDYLTDPPGPPEQTYLHAAEIVVPMDPDAARPVIEAKINGQGPYKFILDTGSDGIVLFSKLTDELKLPVTGKARMGDPSDPHAIEVNRVRIKSIKVREATFVGIDADSWDVPPGFMHGATDVRGIIGLSLFADCLTTFDFARDRLVLKRGSLAKPDGQDIIPFTTEEGSIPLVRLSIGDMTLNAHIDSGSPGLLMLPDKLRGKLKLTGEPTVIGRGRTVNSEFVIRGATLDGNVKLGGHVIEKPDLRFITMLDSRNVGNIGTAFLRNFEVTFDQTNKRVQFTRVASGQTNAEGSGDRRRSALGH